MFRVKRLLLAVFLMCGVASADLQPCSTDLVSNYLSNPCQLSLTSFTLTGATGSGIDVNSLSFGPVNFFDRALMLSPFTVAPGTIVEITLSGELEMLDPLHAFDGLSGVLHVSSGSGFVMTVSTDACFENACNTNSTGPVSALNGPFDFYAPGLPASDSLGPTYSGSFDITFTFNNSNGSVPLATDWAGVESTYKNVDPVPEPGSGLLVATAIGACYRRFWSR